MLKTIQYTYWHKCSKSIELEELLSEKTKERSCTQFVSIICQRLSSGEKNACVKVLGECKEALAWILVVQLLTMGTGQLQDLSTTKANSLLAILHLFLCLHQHHNIDEQNKVWRRDSVFERK